MVFVPLAALHEFDIIRLPVNNDRTAFILIDVLEPANPADVFFHSSAFGLRPRFLGSASFSSSFTNLPLEENAGTGVSSCSTTGI